MFQCPVCVDVCTSTRKEIDTHLKTTHSNITAPYVCPECATAFTTEKARKLHRRKQHLSTEEKAPFRGTLEEWVTTRYNTTRDSAAECFAPATVARVVAFRRALLFEGGRTLDQVLSLVDDGVITETLDEWVDAELQLHSTQTVNNHVRYLLLVLRYLADTTVINALVVEYVADLVGETQSAATRGSTTLNMLKMEDPFALARIRDTVVNALLQEQVDYIDPYIATHLFDTPTHSEEVLVFGVRLRNWLELAIRLTNIPCRIQCTRELRTVEHTGLDYVSKLVLRDGQYCRLINQDKSATSHQPLFLPLGANLSAYLHIYLAYGRPPTDHTYVFCTKKGAKWARPSRDLKIYLESVLGLDVHAIDPTGRFIHGSRALMMAVFAIGVHFDQQKMHGFARLLRHSSTTNERFYSMWQQRALSTQAIAAFADVFELPVTRAHVPMTCVQLRTIPRAIAARIDAQLQTPTVRPYWSTCSIGTQTGDMECSQGTQHELDVAATPPACVCCGQFSLQVFGPFGSMRRRKYAGRYYLACPCQRNTDGRFDTKHCLWYPLGYTPLQKSQSSIPRNMDEIKQYIATHR